jgi:hypothetical protein
LGTVGVGESQVTEAVVAIEMGEEKAGAAVRPPWCQTPAR